MSSAHFVRIHVAANRRRSPNIMASSKIEMFVSHILVLGVWLFTAPSSAVPAGGHCLHSPLWVCVPSRGWQRKRRKNERSNLAHQISLKGRSWKLRQGLFTSPIGPCLARWPYLAANEAVNSNLHFRYPFPLHGRMVDFFFFFFKQSRGLLWKSMVKTLHFQCRECVFDPWSGDWDPTCHVAWPKKKRKRKQSRMMSLLQGFEPESQETRAAGPVSSWVWCWHGWTVSLRVVMSSALKSVGQPAQASQGEDRGRSVLLLAAFATNWGTLIKNGLWFLLDNEVIVFKGWTLIQRKKGMVN